LVRITGLCGERGQPLIVAENSRKSQKALKTHNAFKPLWSVADGRNKAATQLPAADREVPRSPAAADAECNPPLNFQYGEANHRVGPRRVASQGRFFERRHDVRLTARVIQLFLEQPCRSAWPEIAQQHTAIHQEGSGGYGEFGPRLPAGTEFPRARSRQGPPRPGGGIGTGDPWLRAGRPDNIDATIGKNAAGVYPGGAGPYARDLVA